jgi:hypothetical protein
MQTAGGANGSCPVVHCRHAFFVRAVSTTINIAARFDAVADYFAATVFAFGSETVNGAFETIEVARYAIVDYFQRLIVFIPTHFTLHNNFSSLDCVLGFGLCSGFLVAPETLAGGPFHQVVFRIFDAFFDELFGEGLFIRCGNFRCFFAD